MCKRFVSIFCCIILVLSLAACKSSKLATLSNEKKENPTSDNLLKIIELENTIMEEDSEISKLKSEKDKELDKLKSEKDSEFNILMGEMNKRTITFEYQRQVEQLIKDYKKGFLYFAEYIGEV